eukprot:3183561-Alexandrium_andersonii.AAC.1
MSTAAPAFGGSSMVIPSGTEGGRACAQPPPPPGSPPAVGDMGPGRLGLAARAPLPVPVKAPP